jgi:hypothetical protein
MNDLNKWVYCIASTLAIVGAVNWGLVGMFKFNLVEALLGVSSMANVVYSLVGVSGAFLAVMGLGRIARNKS